MTPYIKFTRTLQNSGFWLVKVMRTLAFYIGNLYSFFKSLDPLEFQSQHPSTSIMRSWGSRNLLLRRSSSPEAVLFKAFRAGESRYGWVYWLGSIGVSASRQCSILARGKSETVQASGALQQHPKSELVAGPQDPATQRSQKK